MATEVEYVNYKDFVADLETTENPGVDDVTVVSNETDGPRTIPANTSALTNTATDSDLTAAESFELQTANGKKKVPANLLAKQSALETTNGDVTALTAYAQNVAASIAPAFDPSKVGGYKKFEVVMYEGKLRQAKDDVSQGAFVESEWNIIDEHFYNIKRFGYIKNTENLNDVSEPGVYYVEANATNSPTSGPVSYGFLFQFVAGILKFQIFALAYSNRIYLRTFKSGAWSSWEKSYDQFRMYKGSLSGNIDETYTEGCYSVVKNAGVAISGTWPSDIDTTKAMNLLVSVESVSDVQNYVTQVLFNLSTYRQYYRTRISGAWSSWKALATEDFSKEYTDTEIIKATKEFGLAIPYSSQQKLFDENGDEVSSSLYSYFYTAAEGDVVKVKLGVFTSAGFSVVSLWKNGVFVKSLVSGKTTTSERIFKITDDVDTIVVSYFENSMYKALPNTNYAEPPKPNLLVMPKSSTTHGVTFDVNDDETVDVSGNADQVQGAVFEIDVTLSTGDYILTGLPTTSTRYNYHYRIVRADSSYADVSYDYYKQGYIFSVSSSSELVKIYIRVSNNSGIQDYVTFEPMLQSYPPKTLDFVPYEKPEDVKNVYDLIDCSKFNWSGKKMNVIGDSIVEGRAGNWVTIIGNILHLATARNYGKGGCRLAYYGDGGSVAADDSVVARYSEMSDDADIVIVHAGTNDWASQVPLGNDDSDSNLEFNGALNIIMDGLRAKYPTALIIFSAILDRVDYDAPTHGGSTMSILTSSYSEAMKSQCKRHKMVFFDGYEICGFDFTYDYSHGQYTTNDGLHPNVGGAEIFGRKMAGFIKWH